jgi:hypothetical protein
MLIDIPAHQVIIIAVTDGYTSFLSDDEPRCGFDSRWIHWNISLPYSFQPHYVAGVNLTYNRNQYQEYFMG